MIHGRNLIVAIDGVAVAGAKSCKLQLSQDFIEACAPDSGRVHEKIPTTYDWSVSVDCLVPNSTLSVSLKDKLIAGTKCLLTFTDGSGDNRAGFVYIKSCDESGNIGSLATFSASFESTGPLYKYSAQQSITLSDTTSLFDINAINNDGIQFTKPGSGTHVHILTNNISVPTKAKLTIISQVAVIKDSMSNISTLLDDNTKTAQEVNDYMAERLVISTAGGATKITYLDAGEYVFFAYNSAYEIKIMQLSN